MAEHVATNETILVAGGGIFGMTAALEAAETGKNVVLVEKNPALGACETRERLTHSDTLMSDPVKH